MRRWYWPYSGEAYRKAYESDPTSIFGGIVAANRPIDRETAELLHEIFLEIVIAPDFSPEALDILKQKKISACSVPARSLRRRNARRPGS